MVTVQNLTAYLVSWHSYISILTYNMYHAHENLFKQTKCPHCFCLCNTYGASSDLDSCTKVPTALQHHRKYIRWLCIGWYWFNYLNMDMNVIIHPTTYKIYFPHILLTQGKWNPPKENVCNSENRQLQFNSKQIQRVMQVLMC